MNFLLGLIVGVNLGVLFMGIIIGGKLNATNSNTFKR